MLGVCLVAALVTGCSHTGSGAEGRGPSSVPSPAPSATAAPSSTAGASASPEPPADPAESGHAGCAVALPRGWQEALTRGVVGVSGGQRVNVEVAAADGTTFVVSTVAGRQHALQWRRGRQHGSVQDFGLHHPDWQVLGATFDGRYLAYRVDQSLTDFDDFSVYVWDSTTQKSPTRIAHGERDPDGVLMATPFVDPVLSGGWVYWTQTRDRDPTHTVLSGYRISDGHREVLSRGYGRAPVRFGNSLVWADSDQPAETSTLRFLDLRTRRRVSTPAALRRVAGTYYLAGDADTLAWVAGPKGNQLWSYRSSWSTPHLLVDKAKAPQFPGIAGDVVVFGQQDAMYAADLRSWSYAKLTPEYGGVSADGGPMVIVGFAPSSKSSRSVQSLLDTRKVPPLGRAGC